MSPTPTLSSEQLFRSHIASCSICRPWKYADIKEVSEGKYEVNTKRIKQPKLCNIGALLLSKIKKSNKVKPNRPHSFPFVAKKHQKIKAYIDGQWVEAVVKDQSISAAYQYESFEQETGTRHWRTAAAKVSGYEVEATDGTRHYVRMFEVRPLEKYIPKVTTPKAVEPRRPNSILTIVKRGK